MTRYVCVHGHFYQPQRENPGLEAIELQDSAYPWHDWNERIAAECYATNAAARILDHEGFIAKIVNNYERISFNFGATLLQWLEQHAPRVMQALVDADRASRARFSGHGNAIAQVYHHAIMPLCNARDRRTQVRWGIRDFEERFGRRPEGMWLAEAAVDLASLDLLAEHGILFTILSPHQARRVRRIGAKAWTDVDGGRIDPKRAYRVPLPSGRSIAVFFYDGPISRALAFERLLDSGYEFARRLQGAFTDDPGHQLVHVATDGETYGHHHRFGEMALAWALDHLEQDATVRLTNYGEFLALHPPQHEVEVWENSSWSCAHGIERWRSDCGCNTGRGAGWNQSWRGPLRDALDHLRDAVAGRFEAAAGEYLKDPWAARDDYGDVVIRRTQARVDAFLERHRRRPLGAADRLAVLELMEMQRHALTMYTSCGWFFDELSGIETVQVMAYADRVLQLARARFGEDLEPEFLEHLARARSNLPEYGDGRAVFDALVRPGRIDLQKVAAHYASRSLFEPYEPEAAVYCYAVRREDARTLVSGKATLVVGKVRVRSNVTGAEERFTYGVAHLGEHVVHGGIRPFHSDEAYAASADAIAAPFARGDVPLTLRAIDEQFARATFSLRSLFRDEQRRIVDLILQGTLAEVDAAYRRIFDDYRPLMRFLADLSVPLPRAFRPAAQFALNSALRDELAAEELDESRVQGLLYEARAEGLALDQPTLAFALQVHLEGLTRAFAAEPRSLTALARLDRAVAVARALPFEVDLRETQDVAWEMLQGLCPAMRDRAAGRDPEALQWLDAFARLGRRIGVRVEQRERP